MTENLKFLDGSTITAEINRFGNYCSISNPSGAIPSDTSVIELFKIVDDNTSHTYGILEGYSTVYRTFDSGVILSNDGSVYVEPEPVEPYVPTLDELKAAKKAEISAICESTIYDGVTVSLPGGDEHFALTEKDQLNLFGKQAQLASGAEQLEYHQDGHPCRYYTPTEMQLIIDAAMKYVSYHTTYCNSLNMWIAAVTDAEDLDDIYYGADIPVEYQSVVMKDYLLALQSEVDSVDVS